MGLRDLIKRISPPWLADGVAEKYLYVQGLVADMLLEKADEAAWLNMARKTTPTALPYLGADRRIVRGVYEADAAYAERLRTAFDAWRHAGAPWGVIWQTVSYFSPYDAPAKYVKNFTDATNAAVSAWDTYAGIAGNASVTNPPVHTTKKAANWNWDGHYGDWWNRRWLIFYPPAEVMTAGRLWDDGWKWDDGTTWDIAWTGGNGVAKTQALAAIVAQWKSCGTFVQWIIMAFDPTLFDHTAAAGTASLPDGTWGDWHKSTTLADGRIVAIPSRSSSAAFMSGVI